MSEYLTHLNWSTLQTVPFYAAGFYAVNKIIAPLFKPSTVPTTKTKLWNNVFTSLIHSSITGIGVLLAYNKSPTLATDLFGATTNSVINILGKLSTGYFIYDTFDMINDPPVTSDLMVHHAVVIASFGYSVVSQSLHGFLAAALLMEINSVFLHVRQLLNTSKCDRKGMVYSVVSKLNLISFLPFRYGVNGWMFWSCYSAKGEEISELMAYAGMANMTLFFLLNTNLFRSLLKSDVFRKNKVEKKN